MRNNVVTESDKCFVENLELMVATIGCVEVLKLLSLIIAEHADSMINWEIDVDAKVKQRLITFHKTNSATISNAASKIQTLSHDLDIPKMVDSVMDVLLAD